MRLLVAAVAAVTLAAAGWTSADAARPAKCGERSSARPGAAERTCAGRARRTLRRARVGVAIRHRGAARWSAAPGPWRAVRATAPAAPAAPGGGAPPATTPSPTPTPAPYVPPSDPEDDPRALRVSATEFALTLSRSAVTAGEVRVEFDNSRAEDPHDLVIEPDAGGDAIVFGRLEPGEVSARTISLAAGTYRLLCSLLDHEQRGMRARLSAG